MHIFIFCLKHRPALPNLKLWKKKTNKQEKGHSQHIHKK